MAMNYALTFKMGAKMTQSFQQTFSRANRQMNAINSSGTKLANTLRNLAFGGAFIAVAKRSLDLSSSLIEVQNVVDVTFGAKGSKQVSDWSKNAQNSFGISELAAKRYSGTLGAMLESAQVPQEMIAKMSTTLTGLSADFASFYNISQQFAFEKVQAAMAGEIEPLRQLGINLSVFNLQNFMAAKGMKVTWSKLTANTQAMIRYAYILDRSKNQQGDFIRTQFTFANQLRVAQVNVDKLLIAIGNGLMPTLNKALIWFNAFIKFGGLEKITMYVGKFAREFGDAFNEILPLLVGFIKLSLWGARFFVDNWKWIVPVLGTVKGAMVALELLAWIKQVELAANAVKLFGGAWRVLDAIFLSSPIGWIALALAAIGFAGYSIYDAVKNADYKANPNYATTGADNPAKSMVRSNYKTPTSSEFAKSMVLGSTNANTNAKIQSSGGFATQLMKSGFKTNAIGGFSSGPEIFGEAGREVAIPMRRGSARSIALYGQAGRELGLSGGGESIIINFAPTIYANSKQDVVDGLNSAYPEFENIIDRTNKQKGRVSYGN